jgi:soluble lytic murein transglycosylase
MDIIFNHSKVNNIDPYLVSAVIFEESRYVYDAVSWAGACGLMQIMPSTGKSIAKQINIDKFKKEMLSEPETNIKMGTWYLRCLISRFDNRVRGFFAQKGIPKKESEYHDIARILALGSYNGGATRIGNIMDKYGVVDIDEFVENIHIRESREYIKKVLDSYEAYKALYSG